MEPDLDLVGRDVAEASKRITDAIRDVEDIERDAAGWPGSDELESAASEARSALEALDEALGRAFEATDPARREEQPR